MTDNRDNYPSDSEADLACSKALNVGLKSVRNKRAQMGLTRKQRRETTDRTLAFREEFDRSFIVPKKVHQVIKDWLSLDSVAWALDADMQQRCGITSMTEWKHFARENAEFEKYVLLSKGKTIWARDEDLRDKLQRMALRR